MKSNITMLTELDKVYVPEKRGFVNDTEIKLIKELLCLENMTQLELQNMRDCVVLWYDTRFFTEDSVDDKVMYMDKMSAITHVIDSELWKR